MTRRPARWLLWILRIVLAGVACLAGAVPGVLLASAPAWADSLPAGWTQTQWGPLGPADKDLLVRVRLAGLWEMPAGDWAQQCAGSQRIRDIGATIAKQDEGLDGQVRRVAAKLAVTLPDRPDADQRGWLDEMKQARSGADFDKVFVARLRQAHGKIFPVVAAVRAGTRNELVRDFAQTAVNVVMTHMTLVETSGLVDYSALPAPPDPQAAGPTGQRVVPASSSGLSLNPWLVLGVLAVVMVGAAAVTQAGRTRRPFRPGRAQPMRADRMRADQMRREQIRRGHLRYPDRLRSRLQGRLRALGSGAGIGGQPGPSRAVGAEGLHRMPTARRHRAAGHARG